MSNNVFLVRNLSANSYGGGEKYQLMLAEALKNAEYNPIIITNSKELIHESKKRNIEVLIPPYSKRQDWSGWKNLLLPKYGFFQLNLYRWYKKRISEKKPCVVNIQSRDDWIAGTLASHKLGVRVLWTDHADFLNWALWNVNVPFKNIIGRLIIDCSKYVDKIIFVPLPNKKDRK